MGMIGLAMMLAAQTSDPVSISTVTGGIIASECSKRDDLSLDTCVSYILGVADTLQLDGKTCHGQSEAWTLQTVTIVRRYIAANPEQWDTSPAFLIREALMKSFPCPRAKYQKR